MGTHGWPSCHRGLGPAWPQAAWQALAGPSVSLRRSVDASCPSRWMPPPRVLPCRWQRSVSARTRSTRSPSRLRLPRGPRRRSSACAGHWSGSSVRGMFRRRTAAPGRASISSSRRAQARHRGSVAWREPGWGRRGTAESRVVSTRGGVAARSRPLHPRGGTEGASAVDSRRADRREGVGPTRGAALRGASAVDSRRAAGAALRGASAVDSRRAAGGALRGASAVVSRRAAGRRSAGVVSKQEDRLVAVL